MLGKKLCIFCTEQVHGYSSCFFFLGSQQSLIHFTNLFLVFTSNVLPFLPVTTVLSKSDSTSKHWNLVASPVNGGLKAET